MTAKEYLESQLRDEWAEPSSVQTRTALAAYAIRMQKGVRGYNSPEAEILIRSCNCDEDFVKKCIDFLSNATSFMEMSLRIPNLED